MPDDGAQSETSPVMSVAPGRSRSGYWEWTFSGEAPSHRYLIPGLLRAVGALRPATVLDIGCGNGAITGRLAQVGYETTGIDFTPSGIDRARASHPQANYRVHNIDEPLPDDLRGRFDVVVAAEVVEHLFLPRELLARAREAVGETGHVVITTPYHGYWKNLALAALGRFDDHWQPLSDYGHIKYFSQSTLSAILRECGFTPTGFARVGRIPPLAASMIMTGRRT